MRSGSRERAEGDRNGRMKLIVAYNHKRVIGKDNRIPWRCAPDRRLFHAVTYGYPVVMGRKTWESLGSKPLPQRQNVVVSTSMHPGEGYELRSHCTDAFRDFPDAWIIGGQQVYEQALSTGKVDLILVTVLPNTEDGDAFFPELDGYEGIEYLNRPECSFWVYRRPGSWSRKAPPNG
jgi:dihydrofolate reductase